MKVSTLILVLYSCLACITLVLPYQEFESMWKDFNPMGVLAEIDTENHKIRGYELVVPVLPVLLLIGNTILSGFTKTRTPRLIGLILASFNLIVVLTLFELLRMQTPGVANSLFAPPAPIIGIGYYLLLLSAVGALIISIISYRKI